MARASFAGSLDDGWRPATKSRTGSPYFLHWGSWHRPKTAALARGIWVQRPQRESGRRLALVGSCNLCQARLSSCRQAVLDTLDEPCKRVFPFGKDDVVLQNMIEIYVQATVVIEDGDGPAAIDVRPELRLHAVRMAWRRGRLDQH